MANDDEPPSVNGWKLKCTVKIEPGYIGYDVHTGVKNPHQLLLVPQSRKLTIVHANNGNKEYLVLRDIFVSDEKFYPNELRFPCIINEVDASKTLLSFIRNNSDAASLAVVK